METPEIRARAEVSTKTAGCNKEGLAFDCRGKEGEIYFHVDLPTEADANFFFDARADVLAVCEYVEKLSAAIRKHRDQRADDRCWLDDLELYAVLDDEVVADNTLPPRELFLANCARYYDRRCKAGDWPAYQQLEALLAAYRAKRAVDGGGGLEKDDGSVTPKRVWAAPEHYEADLLIEKLEGEMQ